ncbi:MAG: type 4a pilus biogenesis protein PilO [Candidatus Muirbacterium halophilum]|nr:type 4a pilus biogenesis protein PilO [Candidatus Muirbacterium halophilum]MCK9475084.1 type 4a pilus biogenesis protein PilO [Candidatus Muirbacterium halophilum]
MNDKLLAIVVIILLGVGLFGYWHIFENQPRLDEIESLKSKISQLERDIKEKEKIEKEIKDKQVLLEKTKNEFDIIQNSVITSDNMSVPDLIKVVRNYAKQAKVEFNEIKINKLFSAEYWDELPMDFNFTGPYHNMGRMIARLENLKLINARKGKLSLQPHKGTAKNTSSFSSRTSFRGGDDEEEKQEISMDLGASSFIFKKGGGFSVQNF